MNRILLLILVVVAAGCSTPPISFDYTSTVEVDAGDIGQILNAVTQAEIKGLDVKLKTGSYETSIEGTKITIGIGKQVRVGSDLVRVVSSSPEVDSGTNGRLVGFDIQKAHIQIQGDVSVSLANMPAVPITELKVDLESQKSGNGSGTIEVDVALTKFLAGILTHAVTAPARSNQSNSNKPQIGDAISQLQLAEFKASLREGAQVAFHETIQGTIGPDSHFSLSNLNATAKPKDLALKSNASLELHMQQGTSAEFDGFTMTPESLDVTIGGIISVEGERTHFVLNQDMDSKIVVGKAQLEKNAENVKVRINLAGLDLVFAKLDYSRPGIHVAETIDAVLNTSGSASGSFEQLNGGALTATVEAVAFNNVELHSGSKKSKQTIQSDLPVVFTQITLTHQANEATISITVPKFEIAGFAERTPSDLKLSIASLIATANRLEFTKGQTSLSTSFAQGFVLTATETEVDLRDKETKGLGTLTAKGDVTALILKSGDQAITSDSASIDLVASCSETIQLDGGVSGFLAISSGDVNIPGATVSVRSAQLAFSPDGKVKSGSAVISVTIPRAEFEKVVSGKIPAEFDIPKQDIRFKITETIQEEIVEKVPIGGVVGKFAKQAFKDLLKIVDKVVDTDIKTSFENGKVRTNIMPVSFAGDSFAISGSPSVSGKVAGRAGFNVGATFLLKGNIRVAFSEPTSLEDLQFIGSAS